ncbi:lipopolysaccharide biosynthesis protein [Candidatus Latescibacterota bacterium]
MSFLRGFSIAMGANILLFVLSFLNNKLIFITLGVKENGIYFIIMRFSFFIALFIGEWQRLTNINIVGSDKSLNPVISANNVTYIGVTGGIVMLAAFFFPSLFAGFVPQQYVMFAAAVGLCLILRDSFQSLLLVNNHMVRYSITFVLWGSLFFILDIIFLVILDFGIRSVFAALLISTIVAASWSLFSSISVNGFSLRPSLRVFKLSGKMGLRAAVAVTGMFFMINVHPFALNSLAGFTMVGIFAVCFRVFQLFQRSSDVTGTVLYSNVAQNGEMSGYRLTMKVCRNLMFFSAVFAVIGGLLGKYLIIIISDKTYLDAYYPLLLMLPGIVFMNTGAVLNSSYWGRGYPLKVILAPYIAAGFGLIMDIVLIPRFETSGATMSFSLMSAVWFVYIVGIFRRDSGFQLSEILIPRYSDFTKIFSKIKDKMTRSET